MKDFYTNMASKAFDIEHALDIYAKHFSILPVSQLYNEEVIEFLKPSLKNFHIYMIGWLPKVEIENHTITIERKKLTLNMKSENKITPLEYDLSEQEDFEWLETEDGIFVLNKKDGQRGVLSSEQIFEDLARHNGKVSLDIQYIGQAFGKEGSRSVLDRVIAHETLQEILITEKKEGHELFFFFLEIEPNTNLITFINPFAKNIESDENRIKNGFDFLSSFSKGEQTTLYEAALIRHFQPKYNKIFKNSFPSTNLKVLEECYKKDLSALTAEICFDTLPFYLSSDEKPASSWPYYVITYQLHSEEERKVFFTDLPKK